MTSTRTIVFSRAKIRLGGARDFRLLSLVGGVTESGWGSDRVMVSYECQFKKRTTVMAQDAKTNTIRLHRVLRTTPEKVYRAFLDADAKAKWLPPHGFTGKVHHLEAVVGGTYKMSFTNFSTGSTHSFGGTFVELTPNERIRYVDKFDDPNLPGEMTVTINLTPVSVGTEINIVQEGIPAVIPAEACYLGWQESLALLALLVEPEIPG